MGRDHQRGTKTAIKQSENKESDKDIKPWREGQGERQGYKEKETESARDIKTNRLREKRE
jgi:hypothetical protein